jgi:LCP family protein required for cell wall assembly
MSRYEDGGRAGRRAASRSARRGSRARGRRIVARISVVLTFILVAAVLSAYAEYRNVWDSIHHVQVTDLGHRPPQYTDALNILLIGSDSRQGANRKFGESLADGGQRSDTVIVLHISPGRKRVVVMSIPRDSVVPILSCAPYGKNSPGQQAQPDGDVEQINSTFAYGGPGCLWKTIEQETGIRINHFIELDFVGFEKVINDLGGVDICLPIAVDNVQSGLDLSAGEHHVMGREALAYWRTRENIGEGSDLQRIQRDQYLMASLLQETEHTSMLSDPTRMFSVVKDVASAMTTDSGMSPSTLLKLAESLKGVPLKKFEFIQVPTVPAPQNADWVAWAPQATQLFEAIAHDRALPKVVKQKSHQKTTPVLDAKPSQVNVQVLNGSGVSGIAGDAAGALTSRGFNVVGTGDDPPFDHTSSVIEYASATDKPAVDTLEHQLSDVTVQQDPSLTAGTIDLIIGSTYQGLLATPSPSSTPSTASIGSLVRKLKADGDSLNGDARCRSDASAFAGPNSPTVP